MRSIFIVFFTLCFWGAAAQTDKMLYANCNEVYDKGDTTICIEQIDDAHQLIRYYMAEKVLFSKRYEVAKNGDYAFQQVINDYNSPYDGIGYYYYGNAQLKKILHYSQGKLVRCEAIYDKNGNSLAFGTLQNGNGTLLEYDENGLKKRTFHYKNGKINRLKSFFKK